PETAKSWLMLVTYLTYTGTVNEPWDVVAAVFVVASFSGIRTLSFSEEGDKGSALLLDSAITAGKCWLRLMVCALVSSRKKTIRSLSGNCPLTSNAPEGFPTSA